MADISLNYRTAIIVGEDNEAVHQFGHAGKVTCNVPHVAIQTAALQQDFPHKTRCLPCWFQQQLHQPIYQALTFGGFLDSHKRFDGCPASYTSPWCPQL